jgi:nucleoside-diphosphate-sugar epimerase
VTSLGKVIIMRIFVTGASGWIGSAVVPALLDGGHHVLGMARTDAGAAAVAALGAEPWRGDLDHPETLQAGAAASEGVIHLAYDHDFSRMAEAADKDLAAINAIGEALAGTGHPLLIASGTVGLAPGRVATEHDTPDLVAHPRIAGAQATLALAARGVRGIVMRFPPTVHGPGDHGFIATLVDIARERGVSAYVGDGSNRWPAVHRLDAADLVRLAIEQAPAGTSLHATAEDGIPAIVIAEAIGRSLGLPVASVAAEDAAEHFGWIGRFFGTDAAASSSFTRDLLGWEPTRAGLIDDITAGHYLRS